MRTESLTNGYVWLRIANARWTDPLDPMFAAAKGGRWNPPGSHPTLYLNEDLVTARFNLGLFIESWPYEPEDLRDDTGPVLIHATLPANQTVTDVHSPDGVAAVGLPATYPVDQNGRLVSHDRCRKIGLETKQLGLRGIRSRSAQTPKGSGRELAWFPATPRSRAKVCATQPFATWYWG